MFSGKNINLYELGPSSCYTVILAYLYKAKPFKRICLEGDVLRFGFLKPVRALCGIENINEVFLHFSFLVLPCCSSFNPLPFRLFGLLVNQFFSF